jgi:hypothetical protein
VKGENLSLKLGALALSLTPICLICYNIGAFDISVVEQLLANQLALPLVPPNHQRKITLKDTSNKWQNKEQ